MIENRQLITSAIAEKMTKKAKSALEPQIYGELSNANEVDKGKKSVSENGEHTTKTPPRRVMSHRLQCLSLTGHKIMYTMCG